MRSEMQAHARARTADEITSAAETFHFHAESTRRVHELDSLIFNFFGLAMAVVFVAILI